MPRNARPANYHKVVSYDMLTMTRNALEIWEELTRDEAASLAQGGLTATDIAYLAYLLEEDKSGYEWSDRVRNVLQTLYVHLLEAKAKKGGGVVTLAIYAQDAE